VRAAPAPTVCDFHKTQLHGKSGFAGNPKSWRNRPSHSSGLPGTSHGDGFGGFKKTGCADGSVF
jgi:hypothetical protein